MSGRKARGRVLPCSKGNPKVSVRQRGQTRGTNLLYSQSSGPSSSASYTAESSGLSPSWEQVSFPSGSKKYIPYPSFSLFPSSSESGSSSVVLLPLRGSRSDISWVSAPSPSKETQGVFPFGRCLSLPTRNGDSLGAHNICVLETNFTPSSRNSNLHKTTTTRPATYQSTATSYEETAQYRQFPQPTIPFQPSTPTDPAFLPAAISAFSDNSCEVMEESSSGFEDRKVVIRTLACVLQRLIDVNCKVRKAVLSFFFIF